MRANEDMFVENEVEREVEWKYGACHACHGSPCPIRAKVVDGKVVKIEGQNIPGLEGKLCAKGNALLDQLYRPDRLKYPLKRIGKKGEGKFKRISWDEALDEIAKVLNKYKEEGHPEYVHMAYGCGQIGNIPMFRYFSQVYGTPNFSHHHGDACNGSGSAAAKITGIPLFRTDYANAKYVLELSHNPLGGGTAPIHFSVGAFNQAMRKGTKIVVVDPRLSETAGISKTEWVPIKPGTDGAFFLGIINILISNGLYDESFLLKYTNSPTLIQPNGSPLKNAKGDFLVWDEKFGNTKPMEESERPVLFGTYNITIEGYEKSCKTAFQLLAERAAEYTPEKVFEITTVPVNKIIEIATDIGYAKPAVATNWNDAHSCFYTNSMQTWRLRHILAMLLGSFDVPGGMFLGNLNIIGKANMGSSEDVFTSIALAKPPVKQTKPITVPSIELGTDSFKFPFADAIPKFTIRSILEGKPYPIKAMIVYANSLLNSHTHTQQYRKALEKEDLFLVAIDIWPNDHIAYADIVLPDACSLERLEIFARLRSNNLIMIAPLLPVIEPLYETRDIADVYIDLAHRLGLKEYFDFSKEEWFDAQIKPLGLDRKYFQEHGAYCEVIEPNYYNFPYKVKPKTPTGRLELYSTMTPILDLFAKTKDPHADPLPNYIPLEVGEPEEKNEFYLLSAKCAITETALSQDNSYLMEEHIDGLGLTKLWINTDKASQLGIKEGDLVRVWSESTGGEGFIKAKVTEGLHPSSVFAFVGFGHKSKEMKVLKGKKGINVNEFIPDHMELVSGGAACQEGIVKIERVR